MIEIHIEDHSNEILRDLQRNMNRALEEIGLQAQKYAIMKTPTDTGNLKNSISHLVKEDSVYIGTNVEYGIYVELGTGRYASNGKGRPGWWVYVKDSMGGGVKHASAMRKIYTEAEARKIVAILRKKGLDAHMTQGIKPHHMLRDAAANHTAQYKRIIERALKGE